MNQTCADRTQVRLTSACLTLPRGDVGKGYADAGWYLRPVAVVVDWLDSCRVRSLENLLDLYDARGSLSCACAGPYIYQGRKDIARYWSPRLEKAVPHAFSLTELMPADNNISNGPR
jgi:hypothetical protein